MPICADARALGEFAAAHHGTFTLSQAADRGITRHDIRRMERDGLLLRIRPSIWRFASTPDSWRGDTYAALLGVRAVAARETAAALHRVDGLDRPPAKPQILCHHAAAVRVPGADVRRTKSLPRADVTQVDGIWCTTLARTVCDLAPLVTTEQLIRAVDDIQRRGASMAWLLERAMKLQVTGRSGPTAVLEIVRRRTGGYRVPESYFERLIGRCLQSPLLIGTERQHVLLNDDGAFVARFDLAIPWVRLGIEAHSRSYHLGELAERYDEDRDMRASQQGWETTYLGFAATRAPAAVCTDIERIVERRMKDLGLVMPDPL